MPTNATDYNREYQAKRRGTKRSYVSEIKALTAQVKALKICLAWEAGELSEGLAAHLLGVDRLAARIIRTDAIAQGAGYESWDELLANRNEVKP